MQPLGGSAGFLSLTDQTMAVVVIATQSLVGEMYNLTALPARSTRSGSRT
jgi:hypothetical protein